MLPIVLVISFVIYKAAVKYLGIEPIRIMGVEIDPPPKLGDEDTRRDLVG